MVERLATADGRHAWAQLALGSTNKQLNLAKRQPIASSSPLQPPAESRHQDDARKVSLRRSGAKSRQSSKFLRAVVLLSVSAMIGESQVVRCAVRHRFNVTTRTLILGGLFPRLSLRGAQTRLPEPTRANVLDAGSR
jgi:hypothetical protein